MKKCFLISFLILWDVNPKVLHPITDRFLRQFFSPNFDQWNGIVCRLNLLRSFHQYQALCLCSPNFLWFDFLLHSWQERQFHDQVPMQSESINASTIMSISVEETSHLICNENQVTGFYMGCNTWLKWVKTVDAEGSFRKY